MGDFEPGNGIVLEDLGSAVDGAGVADTPNHGSNSNVRHNHGVPLGPGEEDRVGYVFTVSFHPVRRARRQTYDRNDWSIWGKSFGQTR